MNYRILFFLLILPFFGFSQKTKLDLKSIEKNLSNSGSPYNYEKLIFKFKGLPKSLDSIEAQHLYYGRNFIKDKVSQTGEEFKSLAEAFKNNNFADCIRLGKILYAKDPTNLDVILILLRAYDQTKDVSNFSHHIAQLVMNIGQDYTRGSKTLKDGVIDVWEKGDNKIYIKVLYLDLIF
ncbi:MAG: DUF4919 domain-containing protein [Chryseobacterium sp.]|nr:MAG: DUF4919 domain-containing protein [Chryseobacterium sp.]